MQEGQNSKAYFLVTLLAGTLLGGICTTNTVVASQTLPGTAFNEDAVVKTFQDKDHIVVTVNKTGSAEEPIEVRYQNGTVQIVVVNFPPKAPSKVTIVAQDGNTTQIQNANITNINDSTIIVTSENRTVTTTPAGTVVIDPPACDCPQTLPTKNTSPIDGKGGNDTAGVAGFLQRSPERMQ